MIACDNNREVVCEDVSTAGSGVVVGVAGDEAAGTHNFFVYIKNITKVCGNTVYR